MTRALSHLKRYPNARKSTLDYLSKQDEVSAELSAFIKQQRRQKRIDAILRVIRWPKMWRA